MKDALVEELNNNHNTEPTKQAFSQNNNAPLQEESNKDVANQHIDFFALLPDELILLILLYLPKRQDIVTFSETAKRYYLLSQDTSLITNWLHHHSGYHFPHINEQPFPASYWLKLHTMLQQEKQQSDALKDQPIILVNNQNRDQLVRDFCHATVDFWQQLTQADEVLQQIRQDTDIDWLKTFSLTHRDNLRLLLLHQFPMWKIDVDNFDDVKKALILKRKTFIELLVKKGLLPNYNNPNTRAKLANHNLILFPFLATQDSHIWHEAMQLLYQHKMPDETGKLLSQSVMFHFKLLMEKKIDWASAYLAATFMTVSMSEQSDYGLSINYLSITIKWLTTRLPSLFFADYAKGVGQLVFEMLVGFNDSNHFKPALFRDFRPTPNNRVSSPIDATNMVHCFIVSSPSASPNLAAPKLELSALGECMKDGQTLYKKLAPYVKNGVEKNTEKENADYISFDLF